MTLYSHLGSFLKLLLKFNLLHKVGVCVQQRLYVSWETSASKVLNTDTQLFINKDF